MNKIADALRRESVRLYIYRVASAILLLLAGYGLIQDNDVALWTGLLAAVTELAAQNVRNPEPYVGEHRAQE